MLRVAGELPHPVVQVVGHGDARNDAGELDSGGRSSDGVGFGATVHGRRSWWWLRAPGAALSTTASLASSHCGSGHDDAMADGGELSGAVETAATEAKRARELGERKRSSQRSRRGGQRARGGLEAGESNDGVQRPWTGKKGTTSSWGRLSLRESTERFRATRRSD